MAHNNDIEDMLDHLRRIKSGGDLDSVKIDEIETLEMQLRFLRTFIKYYHVLSPNCLDKITKQAQLTGEMLHSFLCGTTDECTTNLNVKRLVSQLQEFTQNNNTNSMYNFELNDSNLLEYMDYLDQNLNDVLLMFLDGSDPSLTNQIQISQENRFLKQVKIIQKKIGFLRYLYATEINGNVDHDKLESLKTRIQFMANNVGEFCLSLWNNEDEDDKVENDTYADKDEDDEVENDKNAYADEDDEVENDRYADEVEDNEVENESYADEVENDTYADEVEDDILSKPTYLLCLIVLAELEMKKIFLGELKASKFSQSGTCRNQKLPKGFSHHLHSLLVYLKNIKLENSLNDVSARNIDVAIEFLLVFLADVPNSVINGKRLTEVLEKVGAVVGDILCVIQKLHPSSIIKDESSRLNLGSIQILEKIENLKAEVEERYYKSLKFSQSQFPTVGGLSFLDCLLRKLNEMLKSESALDFVMKPHICILEKELSFLTTIFKDATKVHHEHGILKNLHRNIINLAYEAEIAIDSILSQYNALWHLFCSLPTIIKEIKHISAEVAKIWSENLALKPCSVVEPSKYLLTQCSNLVNDEEIVGFENDTEKVMQYLIRGTNELDVIPIVGMGGQGKTTFARKLYNNDMIISRFDVRAWCLISQTYNLRELLQDIFSQVTNSEDKADKVDELADMLRKRLIGTRYLIVLDDMWEVMAWDDLRLSFPDFENGSRILVTTRLENVGKQIKQHTDPYFLPFLTLEESQELLQKRVFQKEGCPPELYDVILEVAERCKGLPLVVVLVAGIIKKKKMEESWWHKVKSSLLSYLGESEEYSLSTMQLSYDNLPDYLRPCLLYMGMFPEDARIPVSKLISLWIAEGFVHSTIESERLEETAEGYLMDLISSNVVMVVRRRYNGKVKYCQVHDVVLHFCLERSREEKFMLAVNGHYSHSQPDDWMESRLNFNFTDDLSKVTLLGSKTRKPCHQHLRSLMITANGMKYLYLNSFDPGSKLRLLKVLDLSSLKVDPWSSATLHSLIHLKYLAVYTDEFELHPESQLPHLETLIVRSSYDFKEVSLPANCCKMEKLRHVEIKNPSVCFENIEQWIFEESSKFENLRILGRITFPIDDVDYMDGFLRRCPNLQELDIAVFTDPNLEDICTTSVTLESLTQLQILDLFFCGNTIIVSELYLPSNLKKLTLYGSHVLKTASLIAGLPNLEYLQLKHVRRESEEWCLGDITFDKLKFLKLVELGISKWDASEVSFPQLDTLVIRGCHELKEIPLSFADIQTLKQIKVLWCEKESLVVSAEKIKEEVEEIEGCDRVDLIIKV